LNIIVISLDHNLLLKAVASTTVCIVILVCYLNSERSEQKNLSLFHVFHFQKTDSVKEWEILMG